MSKVKNEKSYEMWFESFEKENGQICGADIYIGLAEDEEGFDFDYIFISVESVGDALTLDFGSSTNYKFIGTKTFEKIKINRRYPLGTYEFEEPDEATRFNYMMLSRLKMDCDYVVGHLSNFCRNKLSEETISNHIWGESIQRHFSEMYKLYDNFLEDEKPEWLTREEIDDYKFKIQRLVKK